MNDKLFETFADQTKLFFSPLKQINQAFVSQLEKINEFQVESVKAYSEIGLKRIKSAMQVEDVQTVQDFAKSEMEFMNELNQKLLEDAKRLSDIGNQFKTEVEDLMKEAMNTTSQNQAAPKTKTKAA